MRLFDPGRSRALLVGTASYRHLPGIPEAGANLSALADLLTDRRLCGFEPEHVRVITDPADGAEIEAALRVPADDLLFVYYTGHGLPDRRGRLHLGLTGTRDDPALLPATALPFALVRAAMAAGGAHSRVLVLDCCSGAATGRPEVPGAATLASSPHVPPALARAGGLHTAFTGELLTAMRQGVPSGPPVLGATHLFDAVRDRLTGRGLPAPLLTVHRDAAHLGLVRNGRVESPPDKPMVPPRHHRRPLFPPPPPTLRDARVRPATD